MESGLNDGLATPVVLFALAALASEEGAVHEQCSRWPSRYRQSSSHRCRRRRLRWLAARFVDVSAARHCRPRAPFWSFRLSVSGSRYQLMPMPSSAHLLPVWYSDQHTAANRNVETLDSGEFIGYVVWFLAGGLVQLTFAQGIRWQWIVIAVAALTVLRILPVAISLVGTGLRWQSVLFVGWFGPRGLATIVFALLAFEELGPDDPVMVDIAGIVAVTVILVCSFRILAQRYGQWADRTKLSGAAVDPKPRGFSRLHS